MIQVSTMSQFGKKTALFSEDTTLREVLDQTGVGYSQGSTNIDGHPITNDELDMPLGNFAKGNTCRIFNVQKADNA